MFDDEIRQLPTRAELGAPRRPRELEPLAPGSRLGRYEIRGLLGAGGVGRVYSAHDPSLDREVAIKALAASFRDDSTSLRRFAREAKVLAALSHPNIATIYGFEEHDGSQYLVLEKVDGGTLADKIESGPLPVRDAAVIACQIASGLAEAHSKGVIHRDLKPSNVMLTAGGQVKLVDFGLAKSTGAGRAGDVASDVTMTAAVIGTAPYMSPEQVRGEELDTRTDVWAFGCLLYEMTAGHQAFRRRSVAEVLAAVLRDEPDMSRLPAGTPAALRGLIQRCLHKELATRPRHVDDLGLQIQEVAEDLAEGISPAADAPTRTRFFSSSWARVALVAVAAGAIAVAATVWTLRSRQPAPQALALSLELPGSLTFNEALAAPFAFAPSGSPLVVVADDRGTRQLYLRRLDDPRPLAVAGTEGAWQPLLSPDGKWLAFFAERKLLKVPIDGGPAVELGDFGNNPRGATWLADGTIVVAPSQTSALVRVPAAGGPATPFTTLDSAGDERSHRWPEALPGGRFVLFTVGLEGGTYDEARLDAVSVEGGERRTVLAGASYGRYAPSGHLVFVRGGRVYAVRFDLDTLTPRGAPEVVLEGVHYDPQNGSAHLALSAAGDLVYRPGVATSADTYLSWLRPDGQIQRLSGTPRNFRDPRLSPDGSRVAVVVVTDEGTDVRVVDGSGTSTQLSFGLSPHRPTWTPDGRRVTVGAQHGDRWQLLTLADDGTGEPQVLLEQPQRSYPCDWTPDGRGLVFQSSTPERGWDLQLLSLDGSGRAAGPARSLAASPFHEANAVVSPDGRWVAYESDELDGVFQIYARALPGGDRKLQISEDGARWPSWGAHGTLSYWDTSSRTIQIATLRERDGQLAVEATRTPYSAETFRDVLSHLVISVTGGRFNANPRDDRFLVLESSDTVTQPTLSDPILISGWSEQLRTKLRP